MENTPQKPQEKAQKLDENRREMTIEEKLRAILDRLDIEPDYGYIEVISDIKDLFIPKLTTLRTKLEAMEVENAKLKEKADKWDEIMKMCKDRAEKCSIEFLQHKPIELKNLKNPE